VGDCGAAADLAAHVFLPALHRATGEEGTGVIALRDDGRHAADKRGDVHRRRVCAVAPIAQLVAVAQPPGFHASAQSPSFIVPRLLQRRGVFLAELRPDRARLGTQDVTVLLIV